MALRHKGELSRTPSSDNCFLCLRNLSAVHMNIGEVDVSFVNVTPSPKRHRKSGSQGGRESGGIGWLIYRRDES